MGYLRSDIVRLGSTMNYAKDRSGEYILINTFQKELLHVHIFTIQKFTVQLSTRFSTNWLLNTDTALNYSVMSITENILFIS